MGPDGWSEVRLGDVFAEVADRNNRDRLPVLAVTLDRGVVRRDSLDRKMDREVEQDAYLRALPGDIAYNTMRMWQGGSGLVREPGFVSPAYTVLRARGVECPEFWAHAFKAPGLIDSFRAFSQGVAKDRHRLYYDQFSAVRTLRPPLVEQRKIAAILSSVDETIEKTEAVIAKLDVVKRAMLEELLTRGIPGRHSRFKRTEIGEVPEEWTLGTLGDRLAGIDAGWSPQCDADPAGSGEWGVLKVSSVTWGEFQAHENKRLPARLEPRPEVTVSSGDVLVSRANTPDLVGRAVVVHEDHPRLMMSDKLLRLRPDPEAADGRFVCQSLGSTRARDYIKDAATGSSRSMRNISQEKLRGMPVAWPSLLDQRAICDALDSIDAAKRAESATRDTLKATKASLSSELLAGRVRVDLIGAGA